MTKDSELYDDKDIEIMSVYDDIPDMSMDRISVIKDLAQQTGAKTIGIAHCFMFKSEAQAISKYLSKFFKVYTVDCKYGSLKRGELFGQGGGVLCNPAGQANYLNSKDCDINISLALCVGHDMIFNKKSKAYVTTLFSKDFSNGNDMNAAVRSISNL